MSKITDKELENIGIEPIKIKTIQNVLNLDDSDLDNFIENIEDIKGIGPWTVKCLKIYFDLDDDVFLFEDLWIRKRMTELIRGDIVLTQTECNEHSKIWKGYRTQISKFFWRIKPEGIIALLSDEELTCDHFL